ncbi:hypothetical protein BGZ63DRAFT_392697 [Mariannaea sp. PMI_226]|nr:hypothetical protein BGZ63DRAFT_392697 [Mariannaea sp. PMI_226]
MSFACLGLLTGVALTLSRRPVSSSSLYHAMPPWAWKARYVGRGPGSGHQRKGRKGKEKNKLLHSTQRSALQHARRQQPHSAL